MFGLGTIINTAAIVVGGVLGVCLKKGIGQRMQEMLMHVCGVVTMFLGVAGTLSRMFVITEDGISTQGSMLLLLSMVLGSLAGEALNIEKGFDDIGEKLKKRFAKGDEATFVDGFVNASLTVCIGAMAIVGSIQDGLSGDYSMLAAKAVLDFVIVMVMGSVFGIGAAFSALPVFVFQGVITVLAHMCGSFISDAIISDLSLVGSVMIFCVGVNVAFGKKFRVGNMLPALLVPVIYDIIAK